MNKGGHISTAARTCVIMMALLPVLVSESPSMSFLQNKNTKNGEAIRVPDWARSAVWYQIFPERFRNGDTANDPTRDELNGSWPHETPEGWRVSEWTGDWYELQPWERNDARGFYFHVQNRRYGGDLQGVIDKLDYLKDLGITAIYFNPLFESPSLHKYDAASYHHIDNNFGPDPKGDRTLWESENPADPQTWKWGTSDRLFLKLLQEAHRRGIKVIIDGVFNHVGLRFWAFEDVRKNQQKSTYKDWFVIKRWDDPSTTKDEFDYEGWAGVRELPEIRETADGPGEAFASHIHAIVRRWMDPNGDGDPSDGIDGWRLDVAEKVSPAFWRKFRTWVRSINPEAYLVGEVWWEDWQNEKMFNASSWLQGDMFDAVMNYRWARESFRFFGAHDSKIAASEFASRLSSLLQDYPADANQVLLNLYDSHDTDRHSSHVLNADVPFDKGTGVNANRTYNVEKPGPAEVETQKLMVLFQMTYVGAPSIYYGTEAGMWGADDPDCRKPMVWNGMKFSPEASHPLGAARRVDPNVFDMALHDYYQSVIFLRKQSPELSLGSFAVLVTDDPQEIIAYIRSYAGRHTIVTLNNSRHHQTVKVPLPAELGNKSWKITFGRGKIVVAGKELVVPVPPKSGTVVRSEGV